MELIFIWPWQKCKTVSDHFCNWKGFQNSTNLSQIKKVTQKKPTLQSVFHTKRMSLSTATDSQSYIWFFITHFNAIYEIRSAKNTCKEIITPQVRQHRQKYYP